MAGGEHKMKTVNLRINELRRQKNVSQQVLAEALGVTFQTVSKWENRTTMPDITMLPVISGYFGVSVDQLLGLEPLAGEEYIAVESGGSEYWSDRLDYLLRTRKYIWNQDYLEFLTEKVWRITKPVHILDCGCAWGFLASFFLPVLPFGSSYTGIDQSEKLIQEGKKMHPDADIRFLCGDFFQYKPGRQYDVVIAQAVLRHIGKPEAFLDKMIELCKPGGLVICIDVDRELESDGLYIEGMDYSELCSRTGFEKMWDMERRKQDRDYAVGIRLPQMMVQAGLENVDCRMNDKVNFITTQKDNYEQALKDLMETRGWSKNSETDEEGVIKRFMNHGMNRSEAEEYCRKQRKISAFLLDHEKSASVAVTGGLLISYGRKRGKEG